MKYKISAWIIPQITSGILFYIFKPMSYSFSDRLPIFLLIILIGALAVLLFHYTMLWLAGHDENSF